LHGRDERLRGMSKSLLCCLCALLISGCSLFAPSRTVKYILYPVQRGDTVTALSQRFGVPAEEILKKNSISDPRTLAVGQILKIRYHPEKVAVTQKATGEDPHQVPRDQKSAKTVALTEAKKYIGQMQWPVALGRITSRFGSRWASFHEGVDIYQLEGVDILAAHDGEVVYSDDGLKGYGNLVVIKGQGIMTVYGHNQRNLVKAGTKVRKGDRIAKLGQTGHATGPHLHFETRVKDGSNLNVAVDPLVFYPVGKS